MSDRLLLAYVILQLPVREEVKHGLGCTTPQITNVVVVAACRHSIVKALLDMVGRCFDSSVCPLMLLIHNKNTVSLQT